MTTETHRDTMGDRLTFDRSMPGRQGVRLPALDVPEADLPDAALLREDVRLPEMDQLSLVRYFTALSRLNYSIDAGFYPLGSCTMKYNPKLNEDAARIPGFAGTHPFQPPKTAQGTYRLLYELQEFLAAITGMDCATLAPMAGAQGELAGMLMIRAYLRDTGRGERRRVLVPDSAHGTNPATAAMCGFEVVNIPTAPDGNMDLGALEAALDERTAALMLTLPNTLGLFEQRIERIVEMVHGAGAQLYGDGANLNAIAGQVRPGDLGFDAWHINVHKTFATPHGGGGPGAGPVAVKVHLLPYLPEPHVTRESGVGSRESAGVASSSARQSQAQAPLSRRSRGGAGGGGSQPTPDSRLPTPFVPVRPERSIGRLSLCHGNFGVLLRAYVYLRTLGAEGLREMSEGAVVNANYVQRRLRGAYQLPYDRRVLHEVVFSGTRQRARGVKTLDIAKRLIDYGFHPPTIYFPLIVEEALMIEPTEAETRESLDAFCDALLAIAREAEDDPELVKHAPHTAPLTRLDEATAARRPVLRWRPSAGGTDAPAAPLPDSARTPREAGS
ncbi:MAG: aminomethyl-transferring glycine dehydrogenase subunit GcvPB [Chloroflexi bacterium]|nr:aminomethyl-transferring glycine dehydrogenase subunit GcvPB [Chloroflexota bacterium]